MSGKVIVEKENGIAVIRLNRPEVMNAFDFEIQEELAGAIKDVANDDDTKVLILTGAGKAFCAGVDIAAIEGLSAQQTRSSLKNAQQIIVALANMEKPVIAAVNGLAVGAGCSIAMACDIIIASSNALFSQSFVKIGLVSDMGGMYFLPRMVGLARAKELLFTGAALDAKGAREIGMVNRVVPEGESERAAKDLAREIAAGPVKPIGLMKKILNQSTYLDLPSLLKLEAEAQEVCAQTEDHKIRVQAFLNRKKGHVDA
jgi:2-(1,2-epoxy-1,2-dihydrophenyl)acetyl-CoA isomerase